MKRLLCLIGLILSFSCILYGSSVKERIYDDADLFTTNEITTLNTQIKLLQEKYQMDIVIVTTNNTKGKTSQAYANDFYDYNGFGYYDTKDGLLLLIDMDNRRVQISTAGEAINVFNNHRIEIMVNHILSYMRNGDYYNAAYVFMTDCDIYLEAGIPNDSESTSSYSKSNRKTTPIDAASIALMASLGITIFAHFFVTHRYTKPKRTNPLLLPLDVHYTKRSDRYITTHVSHVYMPQNKDNNHGGGFGGGSSTHVGSSGTTHGGGGGDF